MNCLSRIARLGRLAIIDLIKCYPQITAMFAPLTYSNEQLSSVNAVQALFHKLMEIRPKLITKLSELAKNSVLKITYDSVEHQITSLKKVERAINKLDFDTLDNLDLWSFSHIDLDSTLVKQAKDSKYALNLVSKCKLENIAYALIYYTSVELEIESFIQMYVEDKPKNVKLDERITHIKSWKDEMLDLVKKENPDMLDAVRVIDDTDGPNLIAHTPYKICLRCNVSNCKFKCSKCQIAYYCGRECQSQHWPIHKKFCVLGRLAKIVDEIDNRY